MKTIATFAIPLLLLASMAAADPTAPPSPQVPKSFENLKKLVGRWTGTHKTNKGEEPVTVTYEVTSGGSAVLERLFTGSPHEMVSMYTTDGSKVQMTHYCMLGNHPNLELGKSDSKLLSFNLSKDAPGIRSARDPHMHSLDIQLLDPNHIRQEWSLFVDGKKKDVTVIDLARKP